MFRKFFLLVLAVTLLTSGCARAPRKIPHPPVVSHAGIVAGFYHTVTRGQTLYRIAKNYNQDWHELMEANRITDPSQLVVGQKIFIPQQPGADARVSEGPLTHEEVRRLVGPKDKRSYWRTITLHHSGTLQGGAKSFDQNHKQRRMGGLFYHFVIGNGTNTPDGALEVGWRWKEQVKANRPNDIQICLVGDFNRQWVSAAQFSTLTHLVRVLREEYGITPLNIRRHEDIKGKHTECPGKRFPFPRLLNEVSGR